MKRKDLNYKFAREYLYNKNMYLDNFLDDMLIKVNQMFHYENLPDTVPKRILEKYKLNAAAYRQIQRKLAKILQVGRCTLCD